MAKALRKAIIKKSGPESKCVKNRASENLKKNKEISAVNYLKKKEKIL